MARFHIFACFLLLAACGDAADPPPAESDVRTAIMATTSAAPSVVCQPGQTQECKIFWSDASESGVQHCFVSTQECREDGYGWKACGQTTSDSTTATTTASTNDSTDANDAE